MTAGGKVVLNPFHLVVEEDDLKLVAAGGGARDDDAPGQVALRDGDSEKVCALTIHRGTERLSPDLVTIL